MSLATWKRVYYPVPASKAASSDREAVAHSLRKWRGLRKAALQRHKVTRFGAVVIDASAGSLTINDRTCALCQRYVVRQGYCSGCPLERVLGHPCDVDGAGTMRPSVYYEGVNGRPEPMIAALAQAQRLVRRKRRAR